MKSMALNGRVHYEKIRIFDFAFIIFSQDTQTTNKNKCSSPVTTLNCSLSDLIYKF